MKSIKLEPQIQTVDSFIIVNNVDESILKINPFIKEGLFIKITLDEFQSNFANIFYYKKPEHIERVLQIGEIIIDENFYQRITDSKYFNQFHLAKHPYIIMFKLNESYQIHYTPYLDIRESMEFESKLSEIFKSLLLRFRLFKNGDINGSLRFQKTRESNRIIMRAMQPASEVNNELYVITEEEVPSLKEFLEKSIKHNQLTELALENFNLSYQVSNHKIRYISLITALESIFNVSPNQIALTISRHSAIILSKDQTEFNSFYNKVKKMYNARNEIVHGTGNGNHESILYMRELQAILRKIICYCLSTDMNKKQLFEYLNSKGY